ncbi:MAG TPA: histidine triad nucleotide-binding protein [Longimicrobiales bacterium]
MAGCIFCGIGRGEVPARTVLENEDVVAFHDLNPMAPTHVLVIPRRHIESIDAMTADDVDLIGRVFAAAKEVARQEGLAADGYRLVTNIGANGGQTVPHLHVHVLGGRHMKWPPG